MQKCTHAESCYHAERNEVFQIIGWHRRCPPEPRGCGLSAFGKTIDEARYRFKDKDTEIKLESIREKYDSGEKLTYEEHRLLQYSEPMCCSRR